MKDVKVKTVYGEFKIGVEDGIVKQPATIALWMKDKSLREVKDWANKFNAIVKE